jgi:hypothetical protein
MNKFDVVEGNLRAVKDHGDFGGKNMWNLYVKTVRGGWESVQWMSVNRIQEMFVTKLPVIAE